MKEKRKIIDWNHISKNLKDEEIAELKSYYKINHKQRWSFKKKHHRLRRWKLAADTSLVFGTGGIAASIATSGAALIAISSVAIIIQCILQWKQVDKLLYQATNAVQKYSHILVEIRNALRLGSYDREILNRRFQMIDNQTIDHSTINSDKWIRKYNEHFINE